MVMEGLDRPRVIECRRNLRSVRGKMRGQPLRDAMDFEEVTPIVGPDGERLNANALDQLFRIRREDDIPIPSVQRGRVRET